MATITEKNTELIKQITEQVTANVRHILEETARGGRVQQAASSSIRGTVGGSLISDDYKRRYAERAATIRKPKEVSRKVLARSCGDWLAVELARHCVDPKSNHLDIPKFEAILDANEVAHSQWTRGRPGWQGRLRMTGRLALQRAVAEAGELKLPDGTVAHPPREWVRRHTH